MSADDGAINLGGFCGTATQDRYDRSRRNQISGEPHYIKSGEWTSAHGEDVGERVGRGDLAVGERVVNNRCEEIHGLHKGTMSIRLRVATARQVQAINAGIIRSA